MASTTTTSKETSAPETINIVPEGDVVFVVGPTQKRLRVHSVCVKTASPVLNTMFGPSFHEGQQLAKTGSAEIELPEDDADALETIFNIMHGRNDKVRDILPADMLLQVAIAGDKYDCFASLALASRLWLSCYQGVCDPVELFTLHLAACLFHQQRVFVETTAALIVHHSGSFLGLIEKYEAAIDSMMLLEIAATLEETRNQLRMEMLTKVMHDWTDRTWSRREPWPAWLHDLVWDSDKLANKSLFDLVTIVVQGEEEPGKRDLADPLDRAFRCVTRKLIGRWNGNANGLCVLCLRMGEDHKLHKAALEKSPAPLKRAGGGRIFAYAA